MTSELWHSWLRAGRFGTGRCEDVEEEVPRECQRPRAHPRQEIFLCLVFGLWLFINCMFLLFWNIRCLRPFVSWQARRSQVAERADKNLKMKDGDGPEGQDLAKEVTDKSPSQL
mmetsp:Transcript_118113/g.376588  ORF Transcript_118113/g.376588 Transcript_118113/m.376588 type:complete len:114 (+) Transcript_118113:131-472(+)